MGSTKCPLIYLSAFLLLFFCHVLNAEDTLRQGEPVVSAEKWAKLQNAMSGVVDTSVASSRQQGSYKAMDSSRIVVLTLKIMFYLALIAGVLYLVLKSFRKKIGGGSLSGSNGRFIEVIESRAVGTQKNISLVRAGNRILVIGVADGGISLLSEIDDPAEIKTIVAESGRSDSRVAGSFSETVDAFLSKFKKTGNGTPLSVYSKNIDGME